MRRNVRRLNREIGVHTSAPIPSSQSNLLLTYQPQKPSERKGAPPSPKYLHPPNYAVNLTGSAAYVHPPHGSSFNDDDSSVDSSVSNNIYSAFSDLAGNPLQNIHNSTGSAYDTGAQRMSYPSAAGGSVKKKSVRKAVNLSGSDPHCVLR